VIILVLVSKNKGGGGGNSGNRGGRGPSLLDILVLSTEVAEEVVLAADLLVEDLGGGGLVVMAEASLEVARVEVGKRLCKHSIKKSCKLQLFFDYLCVIISERH
jgi:hypothetical protein